MNTSLTSVKSATTMKFLSFLSTPFQNINKQPVWEEEWYLLLSNNSFCSRDIQVFKIWKLVNWWCHKLNWNLINYDETGYLSKFVSEMNILLDVLHNISIPILMPRLYSGFYLFCFTAFAPKCKVIREWDTKSHARHIPFSVPTPGLETNFSAC